MTAPVDLEQWRPVPSDQRYLVSSAGRIKGASGRLLKLQVDWKGYLRATLSKDNKIKNRPVHAIVAEAFIGPRPTNQVCRHLDGDKQNNDAANIAYGSVRDNYNDMVVHGRAARHEQHGCAKLSWYDIRYVRSVYAARKNRQWGTLKLARELGVSRDLVGKIARGSLWKEV